MEPTDIQKLIIEYEGNAVVLASPGSGKTFVLSEKIRNVLSKDEILPYQGVIAISYTRKASSNLKKRTLEEGVFHKNTFFGTIDNFCLTQIILPYGNYVFEYPEKELQIVSITDFEKTEKKSYSWIKDEHPDYDKITDEQMNDLSELFKIGYVLIESLELLALYLILHCKACQNYLKARFKYVFIDEYQDADTYIHQIFVTLVKMGITGIAVGDENQSIFGFAHKNSKYLEKLKTTANFKAFSLNKNFRCSIPIVNYSNRLLNSNSQICKTDQKGVYLVRVKGAETKISNFIDKTIEKICSDFDVKNYNEVAILVKNGRTQKLIDESLTIKHRLVETTLLDQDLNPRSQLYTLLLRFFFDKSMSFMSILDEYVGYETLSKSDKKELNERKETIRLLTEDNYNELPKLFKIIADILLPKINEGESLKKLYKIISSGKSLNSYRPIDDNEVQLMTLHKSKGLEFDVVFHLNMNEWEFPSKKVSNGNFDNPSFPSLNQDLNLHYVGITRAKKACYLICSTQRTNGNDELKFAKDSEFLNINGLQKLRANINEELQPI